MTIPLELLFSFQVRTFSYVASAFLAHRLLYFNLIFLYYINMDNVIHRQCLHLVFVMQKRDTLHEARVTILKKYVEFFLNIARFSLRLSTLIKMAARTNNYATPWLPARQGRFHN